METVNLQGYKIEYLAASAPENEAYREFYVFTGGGVYQAGTLIRIYNGQDPGTSPHDIEHVYLYANHSLQTFEPSGAFMRIKTGQNETLHTRRIYRGEEFDALNTNVIRNQDGTKLFIFVRNGAQEFTRLQDGLYRLQFIFKRDPDSGQPVFKRFGFSDPEETFIEFSLSALVPM
jgi:hypothetical protein